MSCAVPALEVTLLPLSNITHLRQVFTGFHILDRKRVLRVRYGEGAERLGISAGVDLDREAYCVGADVKGLGLLIYDVHDSDVINAKLLERAQMYFKRSYNPQLHREHKKIRPLGLNLLVEDSPSVMAARRALRFGRGRSRYGDVLRAIGVSPPYTARETDLTALPIARDNPKVLFMTRVWQPEGYYGVTPEETRDRKSLNDMRADCIRTLRSALGERFVGGLIPDAFTLEHYPDAALKGGEPARKDLYLKGLEEFDICIATRGLLGSTGWKFAEYLAKGRAIISESMTNQATGPLQVGVNYLSFASPDECLVGVETLLNDVTRRQTMMIANQDYFDAYVRPEALVRRTIATAIAELRPASPNAP